MTESGTPRFKLNWRALAVSLIICLTAFAVVWTLREQGDLEYLELKTYDVLIRHQRRDYSFSSNFLLVGIDETDIQHFKQYPVSDKTLAELLDRLEDSNPRAIGMDIVRSFPVPDQATFHAKGELKEDWDAELRRFFESPRSRNVSWAISPSAAGTFFQILKGASEDRLGSVELLADPTDEEIRRALVYSTDSQTGKRYPSLAYQMATTYLASEPSVAQTTQPAAGNPDSIRLGSTVIQRIHPSDGAYINADDHGFQYLLDYRGPWTYPRVSALDILEGRVKRADIEGKIVVVGVTTFSNRDVIRTPVDRQLHGLYLQAIATEQLLRVALQRDRPMSPWPNPVNMAWALLWSLLGGVAGYRIRSLWRWGLVVLAGVAVLIFFAFAMINRGVWVPLLPPAILWAGSAALVAGFMSNREKEDRSLLMTLFSRQVSPAVAKKIWTQRDQLVSDGRVLAQEIRATIWVSDLTGFAAISHAMSSGDLIKWLNEYTSAVFELVEKHGGIIDKYVGDMVLAVFGAPIRTTQEESASSAVACALEMRARFAELKARWGTQTILGMRMRVGIHTGQLVTGTIGSGEREAYAVIGDAVNVAQALVAYDKAVMDTDIAADGCRIIVSDATRQLLGGQFRVRKIGELEIASPAQAGAIHGVIQ